jgi:DNA modification methylase
VIDPFAGSGTTLLAARQLGRGYFGCDIAEQYVAEARDRLNTTTGSGERVPAQQMQLPEAVASA